MRSFRLRGMFAQPSSFCCMSSDYTISRQWRETSSSQPAEGGHIPYGRHNQRHSLVKQIGFISAQVAQHPQVILGRALGHQCRHPPRLNHEQLRQNRHPPMVERPGFGRVASPLPSSVVEEIVPRTSTMHKGCRIGAIGISAECVTIVYMPGLSLTRHCGHVFCRPTSSPDDVYHRGHTAPLI